MKIIGVFFNGKIYETENGLLSARCYAGRQAAIKNYKPVDGDGDIQNAISHAQIAAGVIEKAIFGRCGLGSDFRFLADKCIEIALQNAKDVRGGKKTVVAQLSKKEIANQRQKIEAERKARAVFA
jgi:hypothetical protein